MVSEHQVRERAYYIWEEEGRGCGRAVAHWLQAEAELHAAGTAAPLSVRPVGAEASLAPSPAKSLRKAKGSKDRDRASAKPGRTGTRAAKASTESLATTGKASRDAGSPGIALH